VGSRPDFPERRPDAHGPSRDRDPAGRADNARAKPSRDRDPAGRPTEPRPEDDGPSRDRDPAGRARNARPRDGLGRPLARDASGTAPGPDAPALPPADAPAEAQELLDAGRPFHAHEVLEAAWKAAPAGERELWQGLAQLAVGLTHARRGNATGAATLLRRGAARVSGYQPDAPHGVDAAGLVTAATSLAALIESEGLGAVEPGGLSVQLRGR
jgi:hypothetical protein